MVNDPKIRLGGLWSQMSNPGVEYLTGKLGTARPFILRNNQKSNSGPDFTMYLAPEDRQSEVSHQDQPTDPWF